MIEIDKLNMKKINRIIGYLDEDGSLIQKQFSLHSSILFGTSEEVIETLEWIKEAYPENDWKIFTLCELDFHGKPSNIVV